MIPDNIQRHHILKALASISKEGVATRRESTKYDLRFGSKSFPPKYVVSVAHRFVNGKDWASNNFGGGQETNNFLVARGFVVTDKRGRSVKSQPALEDEGQSFWEGRRLYAKHRRIERDSRLSRLVKERRLAQRGDLRCDACGFSFRQTYGPRGMGYIEAHHVKPVSELRGRAKANPKDIALVCSNCHRMLHRTRPWLTIDQLRSIVKKGR